MSRLSVHSLGFTLLLGAIGMMPALATDMGLPALAGIAVSLHVSLGDATLTLGVFMAGFAMAQLVFGPLADRWGRRPALLLGCTLFTLSSLACSLAPDLHWLLAARVLEGCGAGAGMVIVFAVVRDSFDGHVGRARLSYVNLTVSLAPMIAPTLGAWLLQHAGWRMIYGALALAGSALTVAVWRGLGETLRRADPDALRPARLLANYRRVLGHRSSLGYIMVNALSFGCLFAYVTDSSYLMIHLLGLSPQRFGLTFAATAAGILCGAWLSAQLSRRQFDPQRQLLAGLIGVALCSSVLCLVSWNALPELWLCLPLLVTGAFCYGLLTPSAAHGALQPLPEIAGVAAAVMGCVRMAAAALVSALVALGNDGRSAHAMTLTMAACALAALLLELGWLRPLRRHPVEAAT